MKRISVLLSFILLLGIGMTGCDDGAELTGLQLSKASVRLMVGERILLGVTTRPLDIQGLHYDWSSADVSIATITADGLLTITGEGNTTVTVKSGNITASVPVEGYIPEPEPVKVTITVTTEDGETSGTFMVGDEVQLVATIDPPGLGLTPTWQSDNTAIATITNTGLMTITGVGRTKIIASVNDEKSEFGVIAVSEDDPNVDPRSGFWEFNTPDNWGKATIGRDLELVGGGFVAVDGPSAANGAVQVPQFSYLKAYHSLTASSGSSGIGEYTIMFDVRLPQLALWYALLQTDLTNSGDAEIFIKPEGTIGVGTTGYHGLVSAGIWYRIVISVKQGSWFRYYLNGDPIGEYTGWDNRFLLSPDGVLLFADENSEDATIDVAGVAIWGEALDAEGVRALGGVPQ
jgi:hypothetical protein